MTNDNKQTPKNTPDKADKKQGHDSDAAVERGQKAIEAQRAADPDPEHVKKEKEEKDAEQWRNEG